MPVLGRVYKVRKSHPICWPRTAGAGCGVHADAAGHKRIWFMDGFPDTVTHGIEWGREWEARFSPFFHMRWN